MFEKEAESKAIETCPLNLDMPTYVQGFVNGFRDGYNKCFEQIQKIVNEHTRLDCIIPELLRLQEKENARLKATLNAVNLPTPELEKASKLRERQLAAKEIDETFDISVWC